MIRFGKIAHVQGDLRGTIVDENEQEIPFVLDEPIERLPVGAQVQFRIESGSKGLVAVSVRLLDI